MSDAPKTISTPSEPEYSLNNNISVLFKQAKENSKHDKNVPKFVIEHFINYTPYITLLILFIIFIFIK